MSLLVARRTTKRLNLLLNLKKKRVSEKKWRRKKWHSPIFYCCGRLTGHTKSISLNKHSFFIAPRRRAERIPCRSTWKNVPQEIWATLFVSFLLCWRAFLDRPTGPLRDSFTRVLRRLEPGGTELASVTGRGKAFNSPLACAPVCVRLCVRACVCIPVHWRNRCCHWYDQLACRESASRRWKYSPKKSVPALATSGRVTGILPYKIWICNYARTRNSKSSNG